MIKVSVILAVYNVEPYLERSLDCLINQTLKDIEIICIDDCSTDKSLEILRDYAKKDDRIIVIESEKNQGAAIARNKGLKIAKGEYLGFIDPDDAIDLNYYEELYKTAKENDVDVVKCGIKTIFPNGRTVESNLNDEIKKTNPYMFNYEWTTAIYRNAFIKENNIIFPEECHKAQDVVFLARVMFKHLSLKIIDGVYYNYYKRENSLNSKKIPIKSIKSALKAVELMIMALNESDIHKSDSDMYIDLFIGRLHVIFYTLFQNDTQEARQMCAKALINNFYKCFNIEKLKSKFPYQWMLKDIENKKEKKLANMFKQYKSEKDIKKPVKWYKKIFSVKNDINGERKIKVIYILGFKFRNYI